MDTLKVEPKLSLPPILNTSTSSESSPIIVKGRLSLSASIENETILSKCTNGSIGDVREQPNLLRFDKTGEKSDAVNRIISNNTEDWSLTNNNDNFELSTELDDNKSFEDSDSSILLKSRNSAITGKYIFGDLYSSNANKALNDTQSNLTSSSQEKKLNNCSVKKCKVSLKPDTEYSKISISSSEKNRQWDMINQGENTLDVTNGQNESQENSIISSSFENEKYSEFYGQKKKTFSKTKSNYNIKLCDKENSTYYDIVKNCTFSETGSGNKNILKYQVKHCEVKLFDYLIEQEANDTKPIEKNELIVKVFNTIILNTKEKDFDNLRIKENNLTAVSDYSNINNSIREKIQVRNNLLKNNQNRSASENEAPLYNQVINDNKEKIEEFINYIKKCDSPAFKHNKTNLCQYEDECLNEYNRKLRNKEEIITKDSSNKNENKLASNEESTEKNDKNNNIYSKFGKCNKLKDVEGLKGKIYKIKTISNNDDEIIKDSNTCDKNESDDPSNLENDGDDVSDRISSRLRKRPKPRYAECNTLPKPIVEEEIKKVVHKITLSSLRSKNNVTAKKALKKKKSTTNGLEKIPQNTNKKKRTRSYVKIKEMRKFLRSKLPNLSKLSVLLAGEDIIERVNIAVRKALSKKVNINTLITTLQTLLYEKNICKNFIEFYTFVSKFTPFSFQKKVMPLSGAFGCNGPNVTKKLSDSLRED